MEISFSSQLDKDLKKIFRKDKELAQKVKKQLILFKQNPKHPSLRVHKLSGKLNNMWSLTINESIRMIYLLQDKDQAYFVDIGTHNEVYKSN